MELGGVAMKMVKRTDVIGNCKYRFRGVFLAIILLASVGVINHISVNVVGADIYEPDDDPGNATAITTDGTLYSHDFTPGNDYEDWHNFTATSGTYYIIETHNLGAADTELWLYDTDGVSLIYHNDDNGTEPSASRIEWIAPRSDNFYVLITEYNWGTGPSYTYDINITESIPPPGDIYEPDNDFGNASVIPTDGTNQSHTFHINADEDWVMFTITPGTIYTIETLNLSSSCDTYIALFESDGTTVILEDDDGGGGYASRIIWDPTGYPAGDYYVGVWGIMGGSGPNCSYDIRIYESGASPDAYEPDDNPGEATLIPTDGTNQTHNFHVSNDEDWVMFSITPGTLYTMETLNLSPSCDTYMELYESDGTTLIDWDDDSGGDFASRIYWNSTGYPPGNYYIRVIEVWGGAGVDYYYDIRILEKGPAAQFDPPHSDHGLDTDSDGPYNFLVVNATVNVSVAGNYIVYGELEDIFYYWIDDDINVTSLTVGNQTVELRFDGVSINSNGEDGPYIVMLYLYNESWGLIQIDMHTTDAYTYDQFQPPPDALIVTGNDIAPVDVIQGQTDVEMEQLTLSASKGSVNVTSFTVVLSGTGNDADVLDVRLFDDADDTGDLTGGDVQLGTTQTFSGGTLTFSGLWFTVYFGTDENLLIVYNISITATVGQTVGCTIVDNTSITVEASDTVNAFLTIQSTNSTIQDLPDALTVLGTDKAPTDVIQGQTDVEMELLTLTASADSVTLSAIKVDLSGNGTDADVAGVKLYDDIDESGNLTVGDTQLGSTQTFSGGTLTFSGLSFTIDFGSPEYLLIMFDISPLATVNDAVGCEIVDETYLTVAPDTVNTFTAINSTNSTILDSGSDVLTVTGTNEAPTNVLQGETEVVMERLTLTAIGGSISVTDIKVDLSGTGSDSDIAVARLFYDTDSSGTYTAGMDIQLGSDQTFVGGTLTFTGIVLILGSGMTDYLFILYDINATATVGATVGCTLVDNTYITVEPPNVVNPFTAIQSTNSIILEAPDTLTVVGTNKAPTNVDQGQIDVEMIQLTLTASSKNVTLTSIGVDRNGSGIDGDIAAVKLYDDVDDSGTLNPGDVQLGTTQTFLGGTLTFSGLSLLVSSGTPENLLIVFDISMGAAIGVTVGCVIVNNSYITVAGIDTVDSFIVIQSTNSNIQDLPDALTVVGTDEAPTNVPQGQTDVVMEHLTLTAGSDDISITSITVDLSGTGGDTDIVAVRLYDDTDDSGNLTAGDTQLGTSQTFLSGTLTFSGLSFVVNFGTPENLLIVFDINTTATPDATVGCAIVDETYIIVTAPDTVNIFAAIRSTNSSIQGDVTLPTITSIVLSVPSPIKAGTVTFNITFSEDMNTTISPTVTFGFTSPYDTHTITPSLYSTTTWTGTITIDASTGDGTHTLNVSGAEDLAGNQMLSNTSFTFVIDTTPPTIIGMTPTGTDVPLATSISITFNESMDTASVENAFSYSNGTTTWTAANGSIDWSANTMTFTPTSELSYHTEFTVSVGMGAEDVTGNGLTSQFSWQFTTIQQPDITSPAVVSGSPTGTDIEVTDILTITFDEPMNHTSVENSITITPDVQISDYSWDGNILTVTFSSDLEYDTEYNVTIGTGAKDSAGNALAAPYGWQFTTIQEPDTTLPTVGFVSLTGTDIEVTDTLTITFDEPMNHTSVENSITITPDIRISDYSWDGNTLAITFSSNLKPDTEYNVIIGTGARDSAGNALEGPYSWYFTTKAEPEEESPVMLIVLVVIIVIVVLLFLFLKKGKPGELPEEAPSEELGEEGEGGALEEEAEERLEEEPKPVDEELEREAEGDMLDELAELEKIIRE